MKDKIKLIIENYKEAFDTNMVLEELRKQNIKISRNQISKYLKELGFYYDKHSKNWKRLPKPQLGRIFIPQINLVVLEKFRILDSHSYILGIFFSEEKANNYLQNRLEYFIKQGQEIEKCNPSYKVLISNTIVKTIGNMENEDLIFQIN